MFDAEGDRTAAMAVGKLSAELMEQMGAFFPESATISCMAIVACVHVPINDQGDQAFKVYVKANDGRPFVQRALLAEGIQSIREAEASAIIGPAGSPGEGEGPDEW